MILLFYTSGTLKADETQGGNLDIVASSECGKGALEWSVQGAYTECWTFERLVSFNEKGTVLGTMYWELVSFGTVIESGSFNIPYVTVDLFRTRGMKFV